MAHLCVTKVGLQISCRNLLDKDVLSKSDPLAALMMQDKSGKWVEYARTERVKNDLNPNFSKTIIVDYYFEMVQKLKFVVYDVDNETKGLDDDDFLGEMECTLAQVVSKKSFTKELEIKGKKVGSITVNTEEMIERSNDFVKFTFTANDLDKMDIIGSSDPFLEISKTKSDGSFVMVYKTEVVKNNLNPSWKPFELPVHSLCDGDYNATIKIAVYDYDTCGSNDFIGQTHTTLQEMINARHDWKILHLINPKKQGKKNYVNSGELRVNRCEVVKVYSFLDYVMGGCQINFTAIFTTRSRDQSTLKSGTSVIMNPRNGKSISILVGVDFTGSNGDPKRPDSLHYMNVAQPNEYLKALRAVGEVCQDYDTDKLFPAFGFGARIPPTFEISHAFPLNFNQENPYCEGIDGVVEAYQACVPQIDFSGPTNAAPIIQHVADFATKARQQGDASQYFILLMLTDGDLSDMEDTKLALIRASYSPMSVIIVGVGEANFAKMEELDADNGLLHARARTADRDIVQFIPFRDFKEQSPALLAQHVLAEVPKQVEEYFNKRNIAPLVSEPTRS